MSQITLKGVIDEDFVNYRVPSMTLEFPHCTFKCGENLCQNSPLVKEPDIHTDVNKLCERYIDNPITEAIVFQGLEPFESLDDVVEFIKTFREEYNRDDDIVIYTGYTEEELPDTIEYLQFFKNIVIKFGRYIPDQNPHFDEILGVNLASSNQYAKRIS